MKLQYMFGNPTGPKKRKKRRNAVAKSKKRKNPRKTSVTAKRKTRKKTKSGKWKAVKKTVQHRSGKTVASSADMHRMRSALSSARATIADMRIKKSKIKDKAKRKAVAGKIKKLNTKLSALSKKYKTKSKARSEELTHIKNLVNDIQAAGLVAETKTKRWKVAKRKKRKKARKKASRKKTTRRKKKARKKVARKKTTRRKKRRKSASKKKKTTRRRKKATKKASRKRKAAPKRRRRRRKKQKRASASGVVYTKKKRGKKRRPVKYKVSVNPKRRRKRRRNPIIGGGTIMKRNNPMQVAGFKVAGYDPIELAELGVGGLVYGMANSYITPMFARIPGLNQFAGALGGTVPTLTVGILANILSDKVANRQVKQALEFIGDGLLGAAVVGAGVHLSQTMLPAPAMSGVGNVSYIPNLPGNQADFGGVDFTPELAGVNYTPGPSLPGHNQNVDFGGFGAYEESAADFGGIPQGLT